MSQALLKAVIAGRPKQVRFLLKSGISTEQTDEEGKTPLIKAVFVENDTARQKILKLLLAHDCSADHTDILGRTALSWACIFGRYEDVRLLLDLADGELDVNRQDINGQTALFHATLSGNAAIVRILVEHLTKYHLSVEVEDHCGISPLTCALKLGYDVCADILIRQGQAQGGLFMYYHDNQAWRKRFNHPSHQTTPKFNFPTTKDKTTRTFKSDKGNNKTTANRTDTPFFKKENTKIRTATPTFLMGDGADAFTGFHCTRWKEPNFVEENWGNDFFDVSEENINGAVSKDRFSVSRLSFGANSTSSEGTDVCNDDGVDKESYPVDEFNRSNSVIKRLHGMFNVCQDQTSPSFRPNATPLPQQPNAILPTEQSIRSFVSDAFSLRSQRSAKGKASKANENLQQTLAKKKGTPWTTNTNRSCDEKFLRRKSKTFERGVLPAIADKNPSK